MEYSCKYCEVSFKRKGDLTRHTSSIKCKEKQNKFNKNIEMNNNILKLEKELEQYKLKLLEQENKIKETTVENNILKIEVNSLKEENNILKTEIKALEKSSEGYRKIVEKAAIKSTNNIRNKDDTNDKMFQIDINVNNKQLNKTKYKDIPEDVIKKDIQTLKLKDNYQLEYRDNDGYINITNLCKT